MVFEDLPKIGATSGTCPRVFSQPFAAAAPKNGQPNLVLVHPAGAQHAAINCADTSTGRKNCAHQLLSNSYCLRRRCATQQPLTGTRRRQGTCGCTASPSQLSRSQHYVADTLIVQIRAQLCAGVIWVHSDADTTDDTNMGAPGAVLLQGVR